MSQPPTPSGTPPASVSVVVPIYNSEHSIGELVERLGKMLPGVSTRFEVILVNDGSRDGSWQRVEELAAQHSWVVGIDLVKNFGQHNALLCGIRAAQCEVIVTMDDDLQHPPEQVPLLLDHLAEGFDVVYGPPVEPEHDVSRNLASWVSRIALKSVLGLEHARQASAFRAFHTSVRSGFAGYSGPYVCIDALLTWGASRFSSVAVVHEPRLIGRSTYSASSLLRVAFNMVTGFTVRPLRAASLMGFAFALFGVLVLIYVVGRYFIEGGSVPGFPFLASIIAIFSGVQLLALGVIGEYLARMHFNLMDRPPYVARDSRPGQGIEKQSE
ncbi:MAG: glycosyltransferase family 2 protein [Deltaproteobacteria bacterium]|nr:glycosyltransferase family 2 protein [Deltaproteobacteria bacterium]